MCDADFAITPMALPPWQEVQVAEPIVVWSNVAPRKLAKLGLTTCV
jgi:hypothetical protein